MKKFKTFIYGMLLLLVAGVTSCKDSSVDTAGEGEGRLSLRYDMGETRATVTDDEIKARLEDYILKIYKYNEAGETDEQKWELIRYYTPAYDVPEDIYLNAGNYKATVTRLADVAPVYATKSTDELTYAGEQEFTITADNTTEVNILCKVINTIVKVVYDFSGVENSSIVDGNVVANNQVIIKDIKSYVSVSNTFSAEDIEAVPTLEYSTTNTVEGYFMLPEEVSNLSWETSYDFSDKTDVDFEKSSVKGVIVNPQPSTIYTLNMKYSKTPDGQLGISFNVDKDNFTESEDDFIFSPQPSITGDGESSTYTYIDGLRTYSITSLSALTKIEIDVNETTIIPYDGGNVIDNVSGVESVVLSDDKLSATVSLNSDFFEKFAKGGENKFQITAYDIANSFGNRTLSVNVTGVLPSINVTDFWKNTATLTALVTDPNASDVKIFAREKGTETWYPTTTNAGSENNIHSSTMTPYWNSATNAYGHAIKTMALGATVGGAYECKLEVDGVQRGGIVSITAGGTPQTIPNANMEGSLPCFGSSNSGSTTWASGNNTFTSSLCKGSTKGGSQAALLTAAEAYGNFAAGNMFLGQFTFNGIVEQTGTVRFGQSYTWTARPRAVKLDYSASLKTVTGDIPSAVGGNLVKGELDKARVYLCIVDWSDRHAVTSGKGSPSGVWDPEKVTSLSEGKILGYASKFITSSTSGSMNELEIPIYWYDTDEKPSGSAISLVISVATSAYGDYMIGGVGTQLWVDNFEFVY